MTTNRRMLALALALLLALTGLMTCARADEYCRPGDTGDNVLALQARLCELGYLTKTPDGIFDADTEAALVAFQRWNGLLATGIADSVTWSVLFSDKASAFRTSEPEAVAEEEGVWAYYDAACAPLATAMPNMMMAAKGMAWNTEEYTFIRENGFQSVSTSPLSTFAADVDTASYAKIRSLILSGRDVPKDAVRIEEMLNYFAYDYPQPENGDPIGASMELAPCPWNPDTLLLQIGIRAKADLLPEERPRHNLVFLIDVSGSMHGADRLDLVKRAFLLMLDELNPTDTVSIVTYASRDEVVLEGAPAADKTRIMAAISSLEAGGSTNSAAGIQTAYQLAEKYRVDGINRILMATDGDFNIGMTGEGDLARLVSEKKQGGVTLTMLGVGYGNYKDNKLEALADYGDGNYYYLDTVFEARRALVTEASGTFVEVAKDVKLQLDFNPAMVAGYRLIGYEDRVMAAEDFADDTKDGGEIGTGHRVTALYEIVPVGSAFDFGGVQSKYAQAPAAGEGAEWLTLSIRWKNPGENESQLRSLPLTGEPAAELSGNMRWAAAVAETGMLLRGSEFSGTASWADALALARSCSVSGDPYKEEFVYLLTLLDRSGSLTE